MKIFSFLYGIIFTIAILFCLFNSYAPEFLHDYWLETIFHDYKDTYFKIKLSVAIVFGISTLIVVYHIGCSTSHELKDKSHDEIYTMGKNEP